MTRPVTEPKADMRMIIQSISVFTTELINSDGLDNHAEVNGGAVRVFGGGGRGARGVSKVTYQGNKDNKCGLTGGQKLVKSRTLWMLTGGHS